VILPRNTFLSALRRFFARRGKVANIYSDSGSNFVGASRKFDHELVKATKENTKPRSLKKIEVIGSFAPGRTSLRRYLGI